MIWEDGKRATKLRRLSSSLRVAVVGLAIVVSMLLVACIIMGSTVRA